MQVALKVIELFLILILEEGVDDPVVLQFSSTDFEMMPTSKEVIFANCSCKYSFD